VLKDPGHADACHGYLLSLDPVYLLSPRLKELK